MCTLHDVYAKKIFDPPIYRSFSKGVKIVEVAVRYFSFQGKASSFCRSGYGKK